MDLFAAETYAGLRRPLLEAETLPTECYLSEEFYQREVKNIFMKGWNLIGRADYVKSPGDYFERTLVGVSLIIMRGADSRIRAFVNACRHRGTKLLEGNGQVDCVRCPYHGWSYNLDGSLRSFFKMDEARNLDPKEFGLIEVKADCWQGFIFVSFDSQGESLSKFIGSLGEHTESYNWEDMVTVGHREVVIKTNWKSYVENSMEPIHLPLVHQKSIGHVFASGKAGWEYFHGENWAIMNTLTDKSRAVLPGDEGFPRLPNLTGTAARGAQYIHVNPCTTIGGDLDCMWFKNMVPEGVSSVRNIAAFCFPKSALERPDYNRIIKNYMKRFYQVIDEDNDIAERQFVGLTNPLTQTGRFSKYEQSVHWFNNFVIDRVVGPAKTPARLAALA
jgi:phenylpropionate dioxygenase-like ring-hydroxylating dioxygenase large terminal subunit